MGKKQRGGKGREEAGRAGKGMAGKRNWELRRGPRKDGSGEEPTSEGGRSEPVERRGPEAAALPHALQPGVVRCPPPPPPQGSRQGGDSRREGRHPTNGTGDRQTRDTRRTHGTRHSTGRNKTKTKKKKSRLVGAPDLGSGRTRAGDGRVSDRKREWVQGLTSPNGRRTGSRGPLPPLL